MRCSIAHDDWAARCSRPSRRARRPNAAAIAQMALENYTEMRDAVLDARFVRRKALALELERRFPERFIPRYSMVMFHPEIPYAEALRRGAVQAQLLRRARCRVPARNRTRARAARAGRRRGSRRCVSAQGARPQAAHPPPDARLRPRARGAQRGADRLRRGRRLGELHAAADARHGRSPSGAASARARRCGERVLLVAEDAARRHRRHGAADTRPAGEPAASRRDRQDAGASARPPPAVSARRCSAPPSRRRATRRRTLLVLDTASGDAERLYARHGWQRCGEIPGYALFPDGRPCATTIFFKPLERV